MLKEATLGLIIPSFFLKEAPIQRIAPCFAINKIENADKGR